MANKIKHEYKCDKCKKPTICNLQNAWHLYDIDDKGEFQEIRNWEADTNEFWCGDCYNKEYKQ